MEPTESFQENNKENLPESTNLEHDLSPAERFSRDIHRINLVIVEMLRDQSSDASDLRQAWTIRAVLAENFINSLTPSPDIPNLRARVQFYVMVNKAIIFKVVENTVRYLEELDDAESFALNENLDDDVIPIGEELDEKIQELGLSPAELVLKLRGIIEFPNRVHLRDLLNEGMDYEDLISNIYGMILDEGGDPDEILAELGVTE